MEDSHRPARGRRTRGLALAALTVGLAVGVASCGGSGPAAVDPVAANATPSTPTPSTPAASTPAASTPADWQFAGVPWVPPRPGDCPQESEVFDPAASTPPAHLDQQHATVRRVRDMHAAGWQVRYARPTALGVVALVSGDTKAAQAALTPLGVWQVRSSGGPSGSAGSEADRRVEQVLQDLLGPVAQRLARQLSNRAGYAGVALWADQGAVLLSWKKPVPADIMALQQPAHPGGVRVIVQPTAYSSADIEAALRAVAVDGGRIAKSQISAIVGCGDSSGLVVGITPGTWPSDADALRAELAKRAGMPVTLIRQGEAVTGAATTPATRRDLGGGGR